ncbi:undecaprenyl/decaprenyl-phosphate alpha-N-acetylglucosaminyl 1-phosphate transferase [Candidatus Roizmanbacteria bacterium]|nr:undecaprenyl/decaprenyl-phosphate alpha-N-acetylglucosaminyl 1-phosphate transferase [Candidatus Roizmanbacteria bacterium]
MILALGISFLLAALFTLPTIRFAKKFKLVTDRRKRKHPAHTHTGIIPRAGGIPLFLALLITTILFIPLSKLMIAILIGSFLLVVMGLFDDYFDLSPYPRFIGNILISTLVVMGGLGIPFISSPFGGIIHLDSLRISFDIFGKHSVLLIADIAAVIWLTWIMNMVNWSKGVDGQMPGFVAITALFLGIIAQRFTAHDINAQYVSIFSFIIAGAFLGFLPFNFYPQKIMPGYGGGSLAGFLLGVLSILSFGKVGTMLLILAIPMTDAIYAIIRRLSKKQSPFKADWGHFHHRLLEMGWGKRRIAVFYWVVSFILGIGSLYLEGVEKTIAFCTTATILFLFIFIMDRLKKERSGKMENL